jgi:hypothetical protein
LDDHLKLHQSEPQRGHLVEGNARSLAMGRKYRILALCGRGADTEGPAVAALGLRECARVHCMGPCMGYVRPYSLAQKVPWGITSMQHDI